jgi:glycogen debranching enzyme
MNTQPASMAFGAPERAPIAQFFIPAAASLQERRPRTLKHGDTFAVFDHNGDALAGPGSPEGIYHRDTRYLSHLFLTIAGQRPLLLSSTLRDDNATLTCDLTNPDLFDEEGRLIAEHDLLHMRRTRFLWKATCFERIAIKNFHEHSISTTLELAFGADFADLFEVRGTTRAKRGEQKPALVASNGVTLEYTGLDGKDRATALLFEPAPSSLDINKAQFQVDLAPGEAKSIFISIGCDQENEGNSARAFFDSIKTARRALRQSASRAASVETSNSIFNEAMRRSVSDLYMLLTDTPEGPYPYAGIPWFSTVFGRDAIITALETLWLDPMIAKGVLLHLAANQATELDPAADAEPGKILHEVRYGEMAELGEVPFRRYYGSVDSTPLFVMLAGAYLERTADLATIRRLWPHIEAALSWIDEFGDRDRDGFVEYGRLSSEGLINQGWKDSHDSVFHEDGAIARGPIALVEIQAYVYGAWKAAAEISRRLGLTDGSAALEIKAEALRAQFDLHFFDDELGTYVLALDGSKKPCRVRSSNAGHALLTGIAYPERAASVVKTMMAAPSFCGWGVRTIASSEARYNPMSYHNGSVWPHDNALVAAGMSRYGYRNEASRIFEGLFAASTYVDLRRLPELFCGLSKQRAQGPTFYPVACSPQAWAAAAPLSMLQSAIGMRFEPEEKQIVFENPVLPSFLDEVLLRRLSVNGAAADVMLRRSGSSVLVECQDRTGPVRVVSVG